MVAADGTAVVGAGAGMVGMVAMVVMEVTMEDTVGAVGGVGPHSALESVSEDIIQATATDIMVIPRTVTLRIPMLMLRLFTLNPQIPTGWLSPTFRLEWLRHRP